MIIQTISYLKASLKMNNFSCHVEYSKQKYVIARNCENVLRIIEKNHSTSLVKTRITEQTQSTIYKITMGLSRTLSIVPTNYLSNSVVTIGNRNGTDSKLKRPMYLTGASHS